MSNKNEVKNESLHFFIWPFKLKYQMKSVDGFNENLGKCGWAKKEMNFEEEYSKCSSADAVNSDLLMINQYFTIPARDIFCSKKDSAKICNIFTYFEDKKDEKDKKDKEITKFKYYIKKGDIEYELPIEEIELHIYKHGVGILFIGVRNKCYSEIYNDEKFLDKVRFINDYGRRISLPFIPNDKKGSICADKLGIIVNGRNKRAFISHFDDIIEKHNLGQKMEKNPMLPADFLYEIINHSIESDKEKIIYNDEIECFSDDRMFVMSIICDKKLSDKIASRSGKEFFDENKYLKNKCGYSLNEELYTLAFIDPKKDPSCQNRYMMKELLENAYYLRWSDYGTVYSMTDYSFNCITGEFKDIKHMVYRPFVLEYKLLFSLVIAQKIIIQSFDERAGKITNGAEENYFIFTNEKNNLCKLQAEYDTFKNQMLIIEMSSQTQGIEIYNLMQKQFMIKKEEQQLEEQIRSIYEMVNLGFSNSISVLAFSLACIALVIDIFLNTVQMWEAKGGSIFPSLGGGAVLLFIISALVILLWYLSSNKIIEVLKKIIVRNGRKNANKN